MPIKTLFPMLLACLAVTACDRVDPNSPVGQRKAIFKEMMSTSEDLGGMLRGRIPFEAAEFSAGALKLDELSHKPWQHFPQIAEQEKSSAKPELWQRQEHFQALVREMEAATGALVEATQVSPLRKSSVTSVMQRVEDACESCHKDFRAY